MNAPDHLLEERLAALEAGQPVDACLAGLPMEEAELVKKAAMLRTAQAGGLAPGRAALLRSRLLEFARGKRQSASSPVQHGSSSRWLIPAIALSAVAVAAAVMVLFAVGIYGVLHLRQGSPAAPLAQQATQPASHPPSGPIAEPALASAAPDAAHAALSKLQGMVEVQLAGGAWAPAQNGQALQAGDSLRTGHLSGVSLLSGDGSQAQIGPDSQLSIDTLDAPQSGARVVVFTQSLGVSQFNVAKSSDPASRFEVNTPSGSGAAKGTTFTVWVNPAKRARFDVDDGVVEVTALAKVVTVYAGQSTVILAGGAPAQPVFHISGDGKVEQTGPVWQIAGRTFRVDADTEITGQPQVGDLVFFAARIVTDGSPILDQVILSMRAPDSQFSFTGKVDATSTDSWRVAGRMVTVDPQTQADANIQLGDTVAVSGSISNDGTLLAERIRLVEMEGLPFEFTGTVQTIAADAWAISGISVIVDASTQIDSGIAAGNTVHVVGQVLPDGSWTARSITLAKEEAEFVLTGPVETMDPWVVSRVGFQTDAHTEIDSGIKMGDRVRVEGRILPDGSWVAEQIELVEKSEMGQFEFTGAVTNTNPLVVNGITLKTDATTQIEGQIASGSLVHVSGIVLPDGSWLAHQVDVLDHRQGGCLSFSSAVRSSTPDQIVLFDWKTVKLGKGIKIHGNIKVAAIVIISECEQEDDHVYIINNIVVIYQLNSINDIIIIEKPKHHGEGEDEDEDDDED